MDLSFHNEQFGTAGDDSATKPSPRLSHLRLMAIVHGRASLAMLRRANSGDAMPEAEPQSMAARRRLMARRGTQDSDYAACAFGSFRPLSAGGSSGRRLSKDDSKMNLTFTNAVQGLENRRS